MYLQGRAGEISLRRNDTKQVRNVSASQCAGAHLPPTVILLSVSEPRGLAVIGADAKHSPARLEKPCLSAFITFVYSEPKLWPVAALGRESKNVLH